MVIMFVPYCVLTGLANSIIITRGTYKEQNVEGPIPPLHMNVKDFSPKILNQ